MTTAFDTTATTDNQQIYHEQFLLGVTGTNAGIAYKITNYGYVGGKVRLTVDQMKAAPAHGDTFRTIGRR